MKFIYFNPETHLGYISDPLTPEDGEAIATGIGYFMGMYIVAALITAVILLPFFIASGLDEFLISFFSVNKNIIIATAIALMLIKLLTVRLSATLIVRFLFALMIVIPVLYLFLYKFHMADFAIIIGKKFDATRSFLVNTTVNVPWLESAIQNIIDQLSKVYFWLTDSAKSINYTAFSTSLSTVNIVSILVCIGKALLWWGLIILFSLLIFVVGLVVLTFIIGLPYFIALAVLIAVNNLIYRIKCNYIRYLKL